MEDTKKKEKYVLALYDIRGKQEYIYKSTKIKEIIGASLIIRECFNDYLFEAAEEYNTNNGLTNKGIYSYKKIKEDNKFSEEGFKAHLNEGYIGEVVYDGGGNFIVLYKNEEVYKEINKRFTFNVMKETYTLRVLTTCIEIDDFSDYKVDRDRLYAKHRVNERKECAIHPVNTLPIVQVEYDSSLPLSKKIKILGEYKEITKKEKTNEQPKVSLESNAKYKKYSDEMYSKNKEDAKSDNEIQGETILDNLIKGKGEDSHLAVIYIDGNNMGAQVQKCLKTDNEDNNTSYENAVQKLRNFSDLIQEHYIERPIEKIVEKLKNLYIKSLKNKGHDEKYKVYDEEQIKEKLKRFVIYAGDEMTFICNAEYAYEVVKTYFDSLKDSYEEDKKKEEKERSFGEEAPSSCAGIAIFHSHAPYSEAYRIAEECCESGKQFMKENGIKSASFIDFHYCQGAIGTSLEDIREHEDTLHMSRPWLVSEKVEIINYEENNRAFTTGIIDEMVSQLKTIGHSNAKTLGQAAKKGITNYITERNRIIAHNIDKEIDFSLKDKLCEEQQRRCIYDIMQVYDLWFKKDVKGENV